MNPQRLSLRWLGPIVAAAALALGFSVVGPAPAAASCDGPVPSFREHATSAARIVIGDVIAVDDRAPWGDDLGRSSRFTLRVHFVLRGRAPSVMHLRDRAFLPCPDHIIVARKDDRIALALGATGFSPKITFDTVAWIRGIPPAFAGIERITVAQAFALVGLAPPETAMASQPIEPVVPLESAAVLLVGLAGWAIAWRRRFPARSSAGGR